MVYMNCVYCSTWLVKAFEFALVWYSEHGTYYRFEFILERVMSATHVAVILRMRTSPAYEEEFMNMDYPDVRNEYGML